MNISDVKTTDGLRVYIDYLLERGSVTLDEKRKIVDWLIPAERIETDLMLTVMSLFLENEETISRSNFLEMFNCCDVGIFNEFTAIVSSIRPRPVVPIYHDMYTGSQPPIYYRYPVELDMTLIVDDITGVAPQSILQSGRIMIRMIPDKQPFHVSRFDMASIREIVLAVPGVVSAEVTQEEYGTDVVVHVEIVQAAGEEVLLEVNRVIGEYTPVGVHIDVVDSKMVSVGDEE